MSIKLGNLDISLRIGSEEVRVYLGDTEVQSGDTPSIEYRWTPSGYTCIGYDKYQNNIKQQSTDSGQTWTNVVPAEYSASTLIESDSQYCGYVPPTPTSVKFTAYYAGGTSNSGECGEEDNYITEGEIEPTDLTAVTVGDCVTEISDNAFSGYTTLQSIDLGINTIAFGYDVFHGCTSLTGITLNVAAISNNMFYGCTSLSSVTINSDPFDIADSAFYGCTSLSSVTIPDSVQTIGGGAFGSCTSLSSITIPDSVTTIGGAAFSNCSSLTSVTIGSGVTIISSNTFRFCSSLPSITIPSGVTSIGNTAFESCSALTSVTCLATTPPTLSHRSPFGATALSAIYVPAASVEDYKSASQWSNFASIIQAIPS